MKNVYALLLLFSFPLNASAAPELRGSPAELTDYLQGIPAIVEITGTSEVNANADNAIVTLAVKTESETLNEAIRKNTSVRDNIRKFLLGKSIKDEQISNSKFSSTPEYGFFGDKPKSYKVNNAVKIKIYSEQELLAVAESVDKFNEVYLVGTDFEHSEKEKYRKLALEQAINNTLSKKDVFEKTLGVKFVIASLTETTMGTAEQMPIATSSSRKLASYEASPRSAGSFGALIYRSQVSIKYKLK